MWQARISTVKKLCSLRVGLCIESSNFYFELKLFTKTKRHTSWNWYKLLFLPLAFCSKDHSWEILYKIKIGLDSEKYSSTVLVSNCAYLHIYLQWEKKFYSKTFQFEGWPQVPIEMQSLMRVLNKKIHCSSTGGISPDPYPPPHPPKTICILSAC